jgi:AraC-like DNA-binding protein
MVGLMQATDLQSPTAPVLDRADRDLVDRLAKSEIYREYQRAFEIATGLPLSLKPAGSIHTPSHGTRHTSKFCQIMASQNKSCSLCLETQQRIEEKAANGPATTECISGLCESAVPVRVGNRVVAYLQTGQVLLQPPSERRFKGFLGGLRRTGTEVDEKSLRTAYFDTHVVPRNRHDSALSLMNIFAMQLSSLSNQAMISDGSTESRSIAKAREYIAEHYSEEISLGQVAKAAGMSVCYFCKVFKREKNVTFTEYLSRYRLEAVKQMLLDPHKRISEAAYDAGFQSLSQFNRVFRQFAGETPSDFRENLHRPGAGLATRKSLTMAA